MKIISTLVFFILLGFIIYFIKMSAYSSIVHHSIWPLFAFLAAISFLSFQLVKFGFDNNREKFVTFFLASVVLRLILSVIFLGVFIFIKIENIQLFAINFIVLYLCVLLFEIFEISRNLHRF